MTKHKGTLVRRHLKRSLMSVDPSLVGKRVTTLSMARSRATEARFATLDRSELRAPTTTWEKLAWIEVRGVPDYLDVPSVHAILPDGRQFISYLPPQGYREEVQRVFQDAFNQADIASQAKTLHSYTSLAPHLAFDSDGWLWPLWQQWRTRYNEHDRKLLSAIASGVRAKGWGGMSRKRAYAWRLRQAKHQLASLKSEREPRTTYRAYCEGARSKHPEERAECERRYLKPLLNWIDRRIGYRTTKGELDRRKLAAVLSMAVSKRFSVRERDLH